MKRKIITLVGIVAIVVFCVCIPAFAADGLDKLDAGGMRILTIVRRIGYWLILIKGIGDLIRAGINGDKHAMGQIVITYVMIYGALFFMPWALRLVEGIF